MPSSQTYRSKIIAGYCIIFYLLMLYKWCNGMFLYQMQPFFFYTREDVGTWFIMATGIHKTLLNNLAACIGFDALFYTFPIFFYIIYKRANFLVSYAAIILLLINWIYMQCYTLYPTNSIEAHIAWMLFPIAFIPKKEETFLLLINGLRYFFLFFFASAGIWKFVQGGIFNVHQMSYILTLQHKELLTLTPDNWYAKFILYLVKNPTNSYILYLAATITEVLFIVGFFTKKYDKLLIIFFILFLVFDHSIMRIPYYDVAPFLLTLQFSPYTPFKYKTAI